MLNILKPMGGSVFRRQRLRLGYVPQHSSIDPIFPLSALEMVQLGRLGPQNGRTRLALRGVDKKAALDALETLGISHLAREAFRDLSGGQQQRVLIARALIRTPELLILDEPTQGMDLPSERQLLDTITGLNQTREMAIILVAHQISLIAGRVERVVLVHKNKNLFVEGDAADILNDERLSHLYEHPMEVKTHADGEVTVMARRRGD
jgi:zinc transport system ATP-binding protein